MRENRTYGSEGGDRLIICSLPLSNEDSSGANHRHFVRVPLCRLERLPNKIRLILFAECLLHGCG